MYVNVNNVLVCIRKYILIKIRLSIYSLKLINVSNNLYYSGLYRISIKIFINDISKFKVFKLFCSNSINIIKLICTKIKYNETTYIVKNTL